MDKKGSIQDIKPSNNLNNKKDLYNLEDTEVKPIRKKVVKPKPEVINTEVDNINNDISSEVEDIISPKNKRNIFNYIKSFIRDIKPFYLISFIIIIIGLLILFFIPKNENDNNAQAKKEAEMVKKELSKHMVLPKEEQIDIRKITNKMDDPFFKDAEIGDYLIIFYKNRIAHIYSIKKDLIINTGVVFIDPKTATSTNKTQ